MFAETADADMEYGRDLSLREPLLKSDFSIMKACETIARTADHEDDSHQSKSREQFQVGQSIGLLNSEPHMEDMIEEETTSVATPRVDISEAPPDAVIETPDEIIGSVDGPATLANQLSPLLDASNENSCLAKPVSFVVLGACHTSSCSLRKTYTNPRNKLDSSIISAKTSHEQSLDGNTFSGTPENCYDDALESHIVEVGQVSLHITGTSNPPCLSSPPLFKSGDGFEPLGILYPGFLHYEEDKKVKKECDDFILQITEKHWRACVRRQSQGLKRQAFERKILQCEKKICLLESDPLKWLKYGFDSIAPMPERLCAFIENNDADELAEFAAGKLLEIFTNPSPCNSRVLQCQRIQSLYNEKRVQTQEPEGPSCVEPATAVDDHHCEDAPTLITEAEGSRTRLTFRLETSDHLKETEGDEDWMAEHISNDVEKIDISPAVIMTSECVILKDMHCAASLVIFSCNGIKIKSYLANNEEGPLSCEFGVEDILSIQNNWYQYVGLIILRIQVLLKDEKCHEDMQHTTGVEELKIALKEYNWPEKQQKINSLHVRYPAVWNADFVDDVEVSGDNLNQQKPYFPSFDEPFEYVVYPKGDPDSVFICKRDVELLQPETFLNDKIIDFYVNYLKNQIQVEEKHRFHFFNCFFFPKLTDFDKDPSSIADGKAAFLRVRDWTREVDIFGKDYIFVPVNFNLHWSLIVICHPGKVANCTDLELDDSKKVPCILHMDSIKGSHAGIENLVQSYLCEEWKERHKETSDDISSRFMNLQFVSLELPQQENSFDCGLFLLHYLELFLAEALVNFNPSNFVADHTFSLVCQLYLNWFPPAEASLKRALIQKLIFELLENQSSEVSNEQSQSCGSPVAVNNSTGIEVLSERCSPLIDCNGNMTQTQDDQGIEMILLERSLTSQSRRFRSRTLC